MTNHVMPFTHKKMGIRTFRHYDFSLPGRFAPTLDVSYLRMLFLYDIGLGAKFPGAETSWVRNVLSTKRLEGETSRLGAKRHGGETS